MHVATFFAKRVELVKKQHALMCANEVEQLLQTAAGLAQKAADDGLIAHDKQRDQQLSSDGFGKRSLAVARRTGQQDPVPGFESIRAKDVLAMLLFNQLTACGQRCGVQEQCVERSTRLDLIQQASVAAIK